MEWIGLVVLLYFLPAGIAAFRSHHNAGAITLLNVLLGWTVLGWIIALVWSATATTTATAAPAVAAEVDRPPLRDLARSLWWLVAALGIPLVGLAALWLDR